MALQRGDTVIKQCGSSWVEGKYLGSVVTLGGTEVAVCETEKGQLFLAHPSVLKEKVLPNLVSSRY